MKVDVHFFLGTKVNVIARSAEGTTCQSRASGEMPYEIATLRSQ